VTITVVVETGSGSSTSNSYLSKVEVGTRIEVEPEFTEWDALTDEGKDKILLLTTTYLDLRFRFYGNPKVTGQALQWPRTQNYDDKGLIILPGVIPEQLKEAQTLLVKEHIKQGNLETDPNENLVKSWSGDGISIAWDKGAKGSSPQDQLLGDRFPDVELTLKSIGERKGGDWLEKEKRTPVTVNP